MIDPRTHVVERVEWHEGMMLSPQHFQLLSARLDSLVAWQTLAAAPFSWGVRRLSVDQGLLPAGTLRILSLDAILPDGTAVHYDGTHPLHGPLELSLLPFADHLDTQQLDVYLTLPVAQSMQHKAGARRFRSMAGPLVQDEVSEAPPIDIARQMPALGLSAGDVPPVQFISMRLGAVARENEVFRLADTLPPLLEMGTDNRLWQRVTLLVAQLRGKAAFIAKQIANPSSRVDERLAHLELKDKLRSLLSDLPLVEAVLRVPHLHPLALYLALSQMLGSLTMLRPGAIPPVPMDYQHADPLAVFEPMLAALEASISEISQQYRERKFELRSGVFEITLPAGTVPPQLYIGLRGQSERDLTGWMSGAIVGAAPLYGSLRERRVLGASRYRVDEVAELGLRTGSGYLLFALDSSRGDILAGEPLVISHLNESAAAQRPQEIVLFQKG